MFLFCLFSFILGKLCEKQNLCASSPCRNGGTCSSLPGGNFKCSCPKGFKGLVCSEDVEECQTNPCKHGGSCVNTHGSYQWVDFKLNGCLHFLFPFPSTIYKNSLRISYYRCLLPSRRLFADGGGGDIGSGWYSNMPATLEATTGCWALSSSWEQISCTRSKSRKEGECSNENIEEDESAHKKN